MSDEIGVLSLRYPGEDEDPQIRCHRYEFRGVNAAFLDVKRTGVTKVSMIDADGAIISLDLATVLWVSFTPVGDE